MLMENKDAILGMNMLAQERKKAGFPVINGTIGMMYDDEGKLPLSPTLRSVLSRHTDDVDLSYSSVGGEPSYNQGLQKWFFGSDFDGEIQKGQFLTLGTIGGTGACSIAFHSSSSGNGLLLLPDLDWPNYEAVAHLYGIRTESYPLFKEDRLNLAGIQKIIDEKKAFFEKITLLINDPCENPTGYCMDEKDWKALIQLINRERKNVVIALIVDCAYLDFADEESRHRIASSLKRLDSGVKVYLAMSFSKTFSFYGLRIGALGIYDSNAEEAKSEYDLFEKRVPFGASQTTWHPMLSPIFYLMRRRFAS
jgi:aromatic-amino-acid transaminase